MGLVKTVSGFGGSPPARNHVKEVALLFRKLNSSDRPSEWVKWPFEDTERTENG
jgi:hypothetical protein